MSVKRGCALSAVLVGCVITAACASTDVADSGPLDELPKSFQVGVIPAIAALGEDVAVAEQVSSDGTATALVSPSGEVTMLPDAPALASRALAPSGGSVVLVGVKCDDCDDPELVAFKLSSQRDRWTPLDMPVIELPRDSMVEFVGATPGLAVFDTGAGLVSVASDGVVDRLPVDPATPTDRSWLCVAPGQETLYRVSAPVGGSGGGSPGVAIGSIQFGTPTVASLSLAETDAGWATEPAPPTPTTTASLESLCTMDGVLVIADGSEYELADGAWSVTPDVPVLVSLGTDSLRATTAATTTDGSIVAVRQHQSGVVRRSAEGEWTDTGVEGTAATAAASGVFVADGRSDTVRFIAAG